MRPDEPYQLPPEFREQPLSARVLEDYALCPRKFLLSFFVSRDDERRFRGGPAALHEAVREALVDCYNLGGPHVTDAQVLRDSFEAHWQGDLCTDSIEEEQLHEQGLQMLQDYHDDHRAQPVEVLATDRRLEATLEGQAFVAVADVVLSCAEEVRVLRFVTSRRPLTEDQLRDDLSAELLWLLAHESSPAAEPQVLFYSLRQRRAREVTLDPDHVAHIRHELGSHAARLYREHDFAPVKGKYCRWCRVRNRCPLWQR
ncbi:MAG: PD-(D/E)XK nuclease family protein [Armatimonadetes bacterium]|nr:PD-(D/E)XK nuclease family protein [Armatimonadota bacterium]